MQRLANLLSAFLVLLFVSGQVADAQQMENGRDHQPGEGMICLFGVLVIATEVGDRCFPSTDAEIHSELHKSVARFERFILDNSKTTRADLENFKKTQGHVGASEEFLCKGDPLRFYEAIKQGGPEQLRRSTEEEVSRPGAPTWGTCF
jgi:hypothetical protein